MWSVNDRWYNNIFMPSGLHFFRCEEEGWIIQALDKVHNVSMVHYCGIVCPDHEVFSSLIFHERFFHLPRGVLLFNFPCKFANFSGFFNIFIFSGHRNRYVPSKHFLVNYLNLRWICMKTFTSSHMTNTRDFFHSKLQLVTVQINTTLITSP